MNNKKQVSSIQQNLKDEKSTERKKPPQDDEEGIDEIGIQADDEDNDQIETERAHNPIEKR
jgi:hypothetical protein